MGRCHVCLIKNNWLSHGSASQYIFRSLVGLTPYHILTQYCFWKNIFNPDLICNSIKSYNRLNGMIQVSFTIQKILEGRRVNRWIEACTVTLIALFTLYVHRWLFSAEELFEIRRHIHVSVRLSVHLQHMQTGQLVVIMRWLSHGWLLQS